MGIIMYNPCFFRGTNGFHTSSNRANFDIHQEVPKNETNETRVLKSPNVQRFGVHFVPSFPVSFIDLINLIDLLQIFVRGLIFISSEIPRGFRLKTAGGPAGRVFPLREN